MQENSSNIRGHRPVQYGTKECGIVFLSEKMYSLHSKGMNLCDNYSKKFYLENIPIDNEDNIARYKDVSESVSVRCAYQSENIVSKNIQKFTYGYDKFGNLAARNDNINNKVFNQAGGGC